MNLLEIKNIRKSYKLDKKEEVQILHGVNVTFNKGEFVSILGESGSGKSTLMNVIGGMDSDFEGEVLIEGKNIKDMKERELDDYRKTKIGFIFQSFNLIPHLSVLENVMIVMQMASKTDKERYERAEQLLTEVGLRNHMRKKPNQLSGGQKQRVAIARALANEPEILLADEPTGALDKETSEQILTLLDNIAKSGKLVITVTHSQNVADAGSRIVRVDDGRIVEDVELKEKYPASEERKAETKAKSLSFFSAFKMSLKNMKMNAKRNILVALGGSIGILSVIIMLAIGNGVTGYIDEQINSNMNPLMIDITKKSEEVKKDKITHPMLSEPIPFTDKDIEQISNIPNVESVEKVHSYNMTSMATYNDKKMNLIQFTSAIDSLKEEHIEFGTLPAKNEVIITSSLAEVFSGEEEYKELIGKEITVNITEMDENNTPVVVANKLKVSGIYNDDEQLSSMPMAFTPYESMESAYQESGLTLQPLQVNAYATDKEHVEAINAELEKQGYKSSQIVEMIKSVTVYMNLASVLLAAIAGISLIVSGIMILVVLYISVVERTREIGILRAVGARKKDVKRIFFAESALLGLFSGTIAVTGAFVISLVANSIFMSLFETKIIGLTVGHMVFGMTVSIVISVIAGLMPSSKAAKLDPMESLRYE